jgi:hypothetical protein
VLDCPRVALDLLTRMAASASTAIAVAPSLLFSSVLPNVLQEVNTHIHAHTCIRTLVKFRPFAHVVFEGFASARSDSFLRFYGYFPPFTHFPRVYEVFCASTAV